MSHQNVKIVKPFAALKRADVDDFLQLSPAGFEVMTCPTPKVQTVGDRGGQRHRRTTDEI
jgi:ketosteroid isomerase-like protein